MCLYRATGATGEHGREHFFLVLPVSRSGWPALLEVLQLRKTSQSNIGYLVLCWLELAGIDPVAAYATSSWICRHTHQGESRTVTESPDLYSLGLQPLAPVGIR